MVFLSKIYTVYLVHTNADMRKISAVFNIEPEKSNDMQTEQI